MRKKDTGALRIPPKKLGAIYLPTTEEKIAGFEAEIKEKLPVEYHSFLLAHNGAIPNPSLYKPKVKRDIDEFKIASFYGISGGNKESECFDLLYNYKMLKSVKKSKPGYLAIGDDPGGNNFWIKLSGKDAGKIYFLDYDCEEGDNPFFLMAESVNELVENLKWTKFDRDLKHPLHDAILTDDLDVFEEKLASSDVDIEEVDDSGRSALVTTCMSDSNFDFTKCLIKAGANLNAQENGEFGWRPLQFVVQNNCLKSAELLLHAGADPRLKDKKNMSALSLLEEATPEMKSLFEKFGYKLSDSASGSKKKSEESGSSGSSVKRLRGGGTETSLETAPRAASGGGSSSSSSGGAATAGAAVTSAVTVSSSTLFTRTARSSSRGAASFLDSTAPTRGGAGAPPEERPAAGGAGKPR